MSNLPANQGGADVRSINGCCLEGTSHMAAAPCRGADAAGAVILGGRTCWSYLPGWPARIVPAVRVSAAPACVCRVSVDRRCMQGLDALGAAWGILLGGAAIGRQLGIGSHGQALAPRALQRSVVKYSGLAYAYSATTPPVPAHPSPNALPTQPAEVRTLDRRSDQCRASF